jgi:hypothetical protein
MPSTQTNHEFRVDRQPQSRRPASPAGWLPCPLLLSPVSGPSAMPSPSLPVRHGEVFTFGSDLVSAALISSSLAA